MVSLATIAIIILVFLFLRKNTACKWVSKSRYVNDIADAAMTFHVPSEILEAILYVESSDGTDVNHAGDEIGVMALRPATIARIKKLRPTLQKFNANVPREGIFLGAAYLENNKQILGTWPKAIIAYNAGVHSPRVNDSSDWYLKRVEAARNRICT